MIAIEFILSSIQLIIVFSSFGFFVITMLFHIMTGMQYYYYQRDSAFGGVQSFYKDSKKISKTFSVIKEIKTIPITKNSLKVKAQFGKIKFNSTKVVE